MESALVNGDSESKKKPIGKIIKKCNGNNLSPFNKDLLNAKM